MSNNKETVFDQDNNSSDWIELYNEGTLAINLSHYSLSDEVEQLNKWIFPNINIPANGTLLFFASGKNNNLNAELHTNFKISSDGEMLFLTNPQGVLINEFPAMALGEDQSLGRLPNGSTNIVLLNEPSPASTNNNTNQITFSSRSRLLP